MLSKMTMTKLEKENKESSLVSSHSDMEAHFPSLQVLSALCSHFFHEDFEQSFKNLFLFYNPRLRI